MNFSPFGVGVPLSTALPLATQLTGKLTQSVAATANGQVLGVIQGLGENGVHYLRPLDANAFAATTAANASQASDGDQQNQQQPAQTLITVPITMPGAKPGDPEQNVQIQVVHAAATSQSQNQQQPTSPAQSLKYQISQIPIQTFGQGATVLTVAYNPNQEGIQILDGQNGIPEGMTVVAAIQPQDIQLIQSEGEKNGKELAITPVALIKSEKEPDDHEVSGANLSIPATYIQTTAAVQEYIKTMHHQNTSLPLSLQQFLKFNNTEVKRELITEDGIVETVVEQSETGDLIMNDIRQGVDEGANPAEEKTKKKKRYKKKPPKPKKPKPGQVHIATALDGTTLFCCPECHMAYPEKELLEQHLIGHKIERRFICDICGAGLKRKEHLERHKLGHNPERPYVCSVCMKGFKRKEHLNLHFVIHSGEKTEICNECGKGFYRKDHLRKHARSHEARRAKEAMHALHQQQQPQQEPQTQSQQQQSQGNIKETTVTIQVPNSTSQVQIPLQITVPHHIQLTNDDEQVSTVVLPSASEGQQQASTVVLPAASEPISIVPH